MIDRFIEVDSSRLCLVNVSGPGAGASRWLRCRSGPPCRGTNGHVGELTDEEPRRGHIRCLPVRNEMRIETHVN